MTHKQYYHNKNNKSGSAHTPVQVREVLLIYDSMAEAHIRICR